MVHGSKESKAFVSKTVTDQPGRITRPPLWRRILNPLRFVVSGGLLAYLVWYSDPIEIWNAWQQADARLILLAFVLQLAGICLSAAKWGVVLRARGRRQPYGWLLSAYFVGQFANNFLPTTVGGDAFRAMQLGRRLGSYSQASASIFIERLTGFLALSTIAMLALTVSYIQVTGTPLVTESWLLWITIAFAVLAICAAIGSIAAPLVYRLFGKYLPKFTHRPLEKITRALSDYFPQGLDLVLVMGMSLLFQGTWVVIHAVCGAALGIDAPLMLYALMAPLTDILGLLPIFVNNIGAREFVFTLYLAQVGVEPALAVSLAFMILTLRLVASLPGGIIMLIGGADMRVARKHAVTSEQGEQTAP